MEYKIVSKANDRFAIIAINTIEQNGKLIKEHISNIDNLNVVQATNILISLGYSAETLFDAIVMMDEEGMNVAHLGISDGICFCSYEGALN